MVILLVVLFWGWVIIIQKIIIFCVVKVEVNCFDRVFWLGQLLDDLFDRIGDNFKGVLEWIFLVGMIEWWCSYCDDGGLIVGVILCIDWVMNVVINCESDWLNSGLLFLVIVGLIVFFIGLFGMVWGIKIVFEDIVIL